MPASFPAHAAAVLPIKRRWPYAFDGVALVIGSAAPDEAYSVYGWWHIPQTHQWFGLVWFVIPVTAIEAWLCRRAAPIVAAHLSALRRPGWLGALVDAFALGDYGGIRRSPHAWYVTVYSALLGGFTHLIWDGLAHKPGAPGWANNLLPFLNRPSIDGWWWWRYGEGVSSVVGGVLAVWMFLRIGRRRLVSAWNDPAPPTPTRPVVFWSITIGWVVAELASWPVQDYKTTLPVQGVRLLWATCIGLLTATGVCHLLNRRGTREVAGAQEAALRAP